MNVGASNNLNNARSSNRQITNADAANGRSTSTTPLFEVSTLTVTKLSQGVPLSRDVFFQVLQKAARQVFTENGARTSQPVFRGDAVALHLLLQSHDINFIKALIEFAAKALVKISDESAFKRLFEEKFPNNLYRDFKPINLEHVVFLMKTAPKDGDNIIKRLFGSTFFGNSIADEIFEKKPLNKESDSVTTYFYNPNVPGSTYIKGPFDTEYTFVSPQQHSVIVASGIAVTPEMKHVKNASNLVDGSIYNCVGTVSGGVLANARIKYAAVPESGAATKVYVSISVCSGQFVCAYEDNRIDAKERGETSNQILDLEPNTWKFEPDQENKFRESGPFIYESNTIMTTKFDDSTKLNQSIIHNCKWRGSSYGNFFGSACAVENLTQSVLIKGKTNEITDCIFTPSANSLTMLGVTKCEYHKYNAAAAAHEVILHTKNKKFTTKGLEIFKRAAAIVSKTEFNSSQTDASTGPEHIPSIIMDSLDTTTANNILVPFSNTEDITFKSIKMQKDEVKEFKIYDSNFLMRFKCGVTNINFEGNLIKIATDQGEYTKDSLSIYPKCDIKSVIKFLSGEYTCKEGTGNNLTIKINNDCDIETTVLTNCTYNIAGLDLPWNKLTFSTNGLVTGEVDLTKLPQQWDSLKTFTSRMWLNDDNTFKLICNSETYIANNNDGQLHFQRGGTATSNESSSNEVHQNSGVSGNDATAAAITVTPEKAIFDNVPFAVKSNRITCNYGDAQCNTYMSQNVVLNSNDDEIIHMKNAAKPHWVINVSTGGKVSFVPKGNEFIPLEVEEPSGVTMVLADGKTSVEPCLQKFFGKVTSEGVVTIDEDYKPKINFMQITGINVCDEGGPLEQASRAVSNMVYLWQDIAKEKVELEKTRSCLQLELKAAKFKEEAYHESEETQFLKNRLYTQSVSAIYINLVFAASQNRKKSLEQYITATAASSESIALLEQNKTTQQRLSEESVNLEQRRKKLDEEQRIVQKITAEVEMQKVDLNHKEIVMKANLQHKEDSLKTKEVLMENERQKIQREKDEIKTLREILNKAIADARAGQNVMLDKM